MTGQRTAIVRQHGNAYDIFILVLTVMSLAIMVTTVGYGDYFPVTELGRITAVFVMVAGVGIIGALASILASLLVSPAPAELDDTSAGLAVGDTPIDAIIPATVTGLDSELAQTRAEMAQTRAEMADLRRQMAAVATGTTGPVSG